MDFVLILVVLLKVEKHDAFRLYESQLLQDLQQNSVDMNSYFVYTGILLTESSHSYKGHLAELVIWA